jgi:hypothetical protein
MMQSHGLIGRPPRPILEVIHEGARRKVCIYPVFLRAGTILSLSNILIYDNATVTGNFRMAFADHDHPSGRDVCDLAGLKTLVARGLLCTTLSEGQRVSVPNTVMFRAGEILNMCTEEDFLQEVLDIIEVLNGRPASWHVLLDVYSQFQAAPTEENRLLLKAAYERVPQHLTIFLLPFDRTPIEIERAISGQSEEEKPSGDEDDGGPDGFDD